ncbi:MAG: GntR family transcriptional regulator [Firmicutes bacterium]|nr:GntR family transcriptional regulator [Bacillota bacterium]
MNRPPSTSQWAENAIRERIAQGVLNPGSRINEAALAQELGISRGPLRESLRRLESEGLVEYLPHRGCVVRSYTPESLWEVATLRSLLEQYAAELAIRRDRQELVRQLNQQLALMRDAAADGDWKTVIQGDLAFHEALVSYSGHQLILRHWLMIAQPIFYFISLQPQNREELRSLAEGHQPIVNAVETGRGVKETVEGHIMEALEQILQRSSTASPHEKSLR